MCDINRPIKVGTTKLGRVRPAEEYTQMPQDMGVNINFYEFSVKRIF